MMPGMPEAPELLPMIRGERVWLRAAERADFGAEDIPVNDAETGHFLGLKTPIGAEGAAEFGQLIASQQGKTLNSFAICLLGERRAIGNVTLRDIDRENGSAEMSIVITEKALQGQGYGTDALNCVVDFGFGELRLERIALHVYAGNDRGIRAYEKAGFSMEGTLRQAHFSRGRHHDVHVMSLLRGEWEALPRTKAWDLP